jgi:hypothetical protein
VQLSALDQLLEDWRALAQEHPSVLMAVEAKAASMRDAFADAAIAEAMAEASAMIAEAEAAAEAKAHTKGRARVTLIAAAAAAAQAEPSPEAGMAASTSDAPVPPVSTPSRLWTAVSPALEAALVAVAREAESAARWLQDATRWRLGLHVAFVCYLAARLRGREREGERLAQAATRRHAVREAARQEPAPPAEPAAGARGADGHSAAAGEACDVCEPTEEEEPICRICFGGREAGLLVSPCLCSGSMRFVHLDCLTHWRQVSVNPLSHVQCDSCHYRYSFRRALYATVLRSALVLHLLTFVVLGALLLLGSALVQYVDRTWFGASLPDMLPLGPESFGMLVGPSSSLLTPASWLGVDASYVLASLTLVGVSGFLSLGILGPRLWPGRAQHDSAQRSARDPMAG